MPVSALPAWMGITAEARAVWILTVADYSASTGLWIILPVKAVSEAKQRLADRLSAPQRQALSRAMLEDVLDAVCQVAEVGGILMVSNDPNIGAFAARFPVEVVAEPANNAQGLNGAVEHGVDQAIARGATAVMVLHGDLPVVESSELERMLACHGAGHGPRITLAPDDERDGTNALLASPPRAISFAYGRNSFSRHCQLAEQAGVAVEVVDSAALALDIDTPADLTRLAAYYVGHPELAERHSCRLLNALDIVVTAPPDASSPRIG